jgi:hypothetical protein
MYNPTEQDNFGLVSVPLLDQFCDFIAVPYWLLTFTWRYQFFLKEYKERYITLYNNGGKKP